MTTVLVTGGAGYIGSCLVEHLCRKGYDVLVLDNLSTGHKEALFHPNAHLIVGDVLDNLSLGLIFEQYTIDCVFHLAGKTLVGESSEKPFLYYRENFNGALNVLEGMAYHGVKKIIFSSTANLFGNSDMTFIGPYDPPEPASVYGSSKYMVEQMMDYLVECFDFSYVCLRYFNAAGASDYADIGEDHTPETHLIPNIINAALTDGVVPIYGMDYPTEDGTCIRDYIHVDDLARAHLAAYKFLCEQKESKLGFLYNIGSSRGYSVIQILKEVSMTAKKSIAFSPQPRREGDPERLVADSSLFRFKTGWQPLESLESIVQSAYNWHKNHPKGYQS